MIELPKMNTPSRLVLLVVFLFVTLVGRTQYFNNGQERRGITWKKIETDNFEVIYPEDFEDKALEVADLLSQSYKFTGISLNQKPKKVSVILHTETVKSNAFLGWAPSRIEMYTTPHQEIYAQDWLEQLAIHEYRHMVQLNKLESEMPKLLRWLFGEHAAALLTAAYLPFWFIEGDAVSTETALSTSGRGRFPGFHREMKALIVEKGRYSYDKAYLGSYKHHVPNYYQLGYFMVGQSRVEYGKDLWNNVLSTVAQKPLSFTAFDKGLKAETDMNKVQLYNAVFSTLETRWEQANLETNASRFDTIISSSSAYVNYRYVSKINDSTYVAYRTSLKDVPRFVSFNKNEQEKVLFTPGAIFKSSASVRGKYIVWTEHLPDKRWEHADKSLMRIFNIESKKLMEFKFDSKMFAPVISPDYKTIAAVEADNLYRFYIVFIDAETGEIIKRTEAPDSSYPMNPSWADDGFSLFLVLLENNQKAIAEFLPDDDKFRYILPYCGNELSDPVVHNDTLFFICAENENDNLFAVNLKTKQFFKVINTRFGIDAPSFRNNELTFSFYTANGFKPGSVSVDSLEFTPANIDKIKNYFPIAQALSSQENGVLQFNTETTNDYRPEKYESVRNLINIHSWAPMAIDPYGYTVNPGVSFFSQNMLSTAEFAGGYRYKPDTKEGEFFMNFKYMGWYPVFNLEITNGARESSYWQINQYLNNSEQVVRTDTIKQYFNWNHTGMSAQMYIPINFSKGRYYRLLRPRLNYWLNNIANIKNQPDNYPKGLYHALDVGVYAYHILKSSQQDLLPNFGVIADITYQKSLPGAVDFGSLISASGWLYLPGFLPNHGLSVYTGYQTKQNGRYIFSDRIRYPRGYQSVLNNELATIAFDYQLPLWYPDINLGRWLYFKRFKAKLFFDMAEYSGTSTDGQTNYVYSGQMQSTGVELTSDLHVLRFIAPLEIGFRSTYLFNEQTNPYKTDFLFNISFTF
jgi:hypothetical protein